MRIYPKKKNIRTNHTIRWGGYNQPGTKRNGIIWGKTFIAEFHGLGKSSGFINKKYIEYFPNDETNICDMPDFYEIYEIYEIKPRRGDIIKFDSHVRCCQKCGGTRYSCKGVRHETNQYGKGVYRDGKCNFIYNYCDDYDSF